MPERLTAACTTGLKSGCSKGCCGPRTASSGEGGIRTHGTVSRSGAFKAPALVHYATSPARPLTPAAGDEHPDLSRDPPFAMARCGA